MGVKQNLNNKAILLEALMLVFSQQNYLTARNDAMSYFKCIALHHSLPGFGKVSKAYL